MKDQFGFTIPPKEKSEPLDFALAIVQEDGSVIHSTIKAEIAKIANEEVDVYDPTKLRDSGIKTNVVQPNSNMRLDTDTLNELNQYVSDNYSSIKNS